MIYYYTSGAACQIFQYCRLPVAKTSLVTAWPAVLLPDWQAAVDQAIKKKKVSGWFLNPEFPYLSALYDLLITSKSIDKKDLASRIKKTGKVKMLVVAGAFLKDEESRLDILAVGDGISQKKFENVVRGLESEIGKELRYSAFTTEEFKYRVNMYDKLVCDVFDFKHEVVFAAPGLSTEAPKSRS
jgi:hypothetical protein